jgi:hypothetical protein
VTTWWYPLRVAAGRFWPGLPLVIWAAIGARRDRRAATICIASAIALALLCVPPRKWGNHVYVAFPLFAIAAGAGAARIAGSWVRQPANSRKLAVGVAFASVVAWCASLLGAGKLVLQPPCVVSTDFASALSLYPPGLRVSVPPPVDFLLIGELAEERRFLPSIDRTAAATSDLLILRQGLAAPPPFHEIQRARGLVLLGRAR